TARTVFIGDGAAQTGNITFQNAAFKAGTNVTAAQLATGSGLIMLDDSAGAALTSIAGNISLTAGTGGISGNASNGTAEIVTTGGIVTLNTTAGVGSGGNRIQFP